ncbi:putative 2-aminoethylphosphonate ABC transporter substrate-binding protein [Gloeocapsa sp. PCC 73106]|uniref:putative 2-aminoethylphosphonate ABC transporter substrate-binding protein n=1 Tax=Gloeocapsa sp. PCC 73106 TaxID=102232 RepID=UPI0002AC982A|nr:putative 2-aminoethylphosphonate ABC transporter substrate-binding protein [Gloeocapsa sp. PCC 73106]ELR98108.1 periplasmic 2-aminoethylphosphonate-binding protein [Gloeocapsa sp. PCC 73106]
MKKILRKFLVNFLSTLLVVSLVASCTTREQLTTNTNTGTGTTGNAPTQETITVYTAIEDDQIAVYLPLFRETHPNINVNIVRDSTGIVTAKLLAEKTNPQADVVWGTAVSSLLIADKEGILAPYAPQGLEKVEEKFRDSRNPPHWVGNNVWMSAFCVNTEETARKNLPIPQSWEDLINPVYRNQIVMSNPASSGTGFLSVSAILQMRGEEKGWEYLEALHQNVAQYMHSGSRPCRAAGTGEFPIGVSFGYRAVRQKNDGEPIEPVFPKEGSGWDIEANALINKSQIKEASKTFLDWAITPEVMAKYAQNFAITSVKTDAPVPQGFPEDPLNQLIENDFQWAAENRDRILAEWSRRFDGKSEPRT